MVEFASGADFGGLELGEAASNDELPSIDELVCTDEVISIVALTCNEGVT